MGERGPRPTPTPILDLRQSRLAKERKKHAIQIKGSTGKPSCPEWLSEPSKKVWKHLLAQLSLMEGLLAKVDVYALARYCTLYIQWREAVEFVQQYGTTWTLKNSKDKVIGVKLLPQAQLMRDLSNDLLRFEREFGMTPSARAALEVAMTMAEKGGGDGEAAGKDKGRFFRRKQSS